LILVDHGRLAVSLVHPPLWGAIVVVVLASRRVNLLATVAAAVATVAVLRALS
jgi:branched-subunit amino acid transport protein